MIRRQRGDAVIFLITVIGAAAVVVLIWALVAEAHEWEAFKQAHHCKVVARISGSTFNTIGSDGKIGIGTIPGKTGWACDDGVTYYR